MDASLEAIDASDDPSPSIRFRNANLDENALLSFAIDNAGEGYDGLGEIKATGGGGNGFLAEYDVDTNGILTGYTIISHGVGYTTDPTLAIVNDGGTITITATFNLLVRGNAVYGNLTNDGSTSIDVDDMWVSVDGDLPEELTSIASSTTFGTFFPSETISIIYLQAGAAGSVTSLSVTANGAVASFGV
jgi:archaellum component FlaF (FlaF/FlaG flagellin family)